MRRALDLRAAGVLYPDIGVELGVDTATAFHYVQEALERTHGEEVRFIDVARQMELLRLDRLMRPHWEKADKGNVESGAFLLRVMERRSKLLGLDAPVKVDVEHRIRQMAIDEGLDPDEAVEEARRIIKALPG
jgi:hypothetical protein